MERYCPPCQRTTEATAHTSPPCVVIRCAACGHVHAVRSLPEVHGSAHAEPGTVFEPEPTPSTERPAPAPANTGTASAAERAPGAPPERPHGSEVHRP